MRPYDYGEIVWACGCSWETGTWFPCAVHIAIDKERRTLTVTEAETAAYREAYARSFPPLRTLYQELHGRVD